MADHWCGARSDRDVVIHPKKRKESTPRAELIIFLFILCRVCPFMHPLLFLFQVIAGKMRNVFFVFFYHGAFER
jgi:hypothetical protein